MADRDPKETICTRMYLGLEWAQWRRTWVQFLVPCQVHNFCNLSSQGSDSSGLMDTLAHTCKHTHTHTHTEKQTIKSNKIFRIKTRICWLIEEEEASVNGTRVLDTGPGKQVSANLVQGAHRAQYWWHGRWGPIISVGPCLHDHQPESASPSETRIMVTTTLWGYLKN